MSDSAVWPPLQLRGFRTGPVRGCLCAHRDTPRVATAQPRRGARARPGGRRTLSQGAAQGSSGETFLIFPRVFSRGAISGVASQPPERRRLCPAGAGMPSSRPHVSNSSQPQAFVAIRNVKPREPRSWGAALGALLWPVPGACARRQVCVCCSFSLSCVILDFFILHCSHGPSRACSGANVALRKDLLAWKILP